MDFPSINLPSLELGDPFAAVAVVTAAVVILSVIALATTGVARDRQAAVPEQHPPVGRAAGPAKAADASLGQRIARVATYPLRDLSDAERARYRERWNAIRCDFVDHPASVLARADEFIVALMIARGYRAAATPAERAADLAVDQPSAARSYGYGLALAGANGAGTGATTEDMRLALRDYTRVVQALLSPLSGQAAPANTVASAYGSR